MSDTAIRKSRNDYARDLYEALRGQEPEKRRLAAEALGAMGERGLLLASRDEPGPGQQEAREVLLAANRGNAGAKK